MNSTRTSRYAGALAALGSAALVAVFVLGAVYFQQHAREQRLSYAYSCGRVSALVSLVGDGVHETERCRQIREIWEAMK